MFFLRGNVGFRHWPSVRISLTASDENLVFPANKYVKKRMLFLGSVLGPFVDFWRLLKKKLQTLCYSSFTKVPGVQSVVQESPGIPQGARQSGDYKPLCYSSFAGKTRFLQTLMLCYSLFTGKTRFLQTLMLCYAML